MTEIDYKLLKYTLYTCFFIIIIALIGIVSEGFLYYFSISSPESRYDNLKSIEFWNFLFFIFLIIINIKLYKKIK